MLKYNQYLVIVAQWQSTGLWSLGLRVQVASITPKKSKKFLGNQFLLTKIAEENYLKYC